MPWTHLLLVLLPQAKAELTNFTNAVAAVLSRNQNAKNSNHNCVFVWVARTGWTKKMMMVSRNTICVF